jgi:putative ABC transport system permease protein
MGAISRGVRNTFRNGIRTIGVVAILGLSIGLALTMLVANQAVTAKIASVKSSIGNTITISPAGSRGFEGGGNPLTETQLNKVKATAHVVSVTETLQDRLDSTETNLQSAIDAGALGRRFGGGGGGFGGSGGTSTTTFTPPVMVTGTSDVSSTASLGVGGGSVKITGGKAFDPSVDADVAIIGSALASKNNLSVGSTFTAYNATFTVVAIYDAGNTFSNGALIMPLPTVQRLAGEAGDVTSAQVQVDSITDLDSTTTAIKNELGSAADVTSQEDTSQQAIQPLKGIQNVATYSVVGAVVAGAVIILLTMMMIVRERRREIGVLKAIGGSSFVVTTQFIAESVTFTLIGAIVGLVIGVLASGPLTSALVSSTSTSTTQTASAGAMRFGGGGFRGGGGGGFFRVSRTPGGRFNISDIHAVVGWDVLLWGLLAALVIAVVGSAVPAWMTTKIRPAEVMRNDQ